MVKNKTSDCIDNGISPTDEQNPIDELDPDIDYSKKPLMDSEKIMKIIPHRPPFLLIDEIHELSESHAIGVYNVTSELYNQCGITGDIDIKNFLPLIFLFEFFFP